ncbi:MAG: hypothetical protein MZV70_36120 [Desulfobacterales bacterium]|nr:hypothetical protein [Desulfobacterales bacterium]
MRMYIDALMINAYARRSTTCAIAIGGIFTVETCMHFDRLGSLSDRSHYEIAILDRHSSRQFQMGLDGCWLMGLDGFQRRVTSNTYENRWGYLEVHSRRNAGREHQHLLLSQRRFPGNVHLLQSHRQTLRALCSSRRIAEISRCLRQWMSTSTTFGSTTKQLRARALQGECEIRRHLLQGRELPGRVESH